VASAFWTLFISTLFIGVANGSVEAACQSAHHKHVILTRRQRRLTGFMLVSDRNCYGGLVVFLLIDQPPDWRYAMAMMLIPTFVYDICSSSKIPQTRKVVAGLLIRIFSRPVSVLFPFHGILHDTYRSH